MFFFLVVKAQQYIFLAYKVGFSRQVCETSRFKEKGKDKIIQQKKEENSMLYIIPKAL